MFNTKLKEDIEELKKKNAHLAKANSTNYTSKTQAEHRLREAEKALIEGRNQLVKAAEINSGMVEKIKKLDEKLFIAEENAKVNQPIKDIEEYLDPIPTDPELRKSYVSTVAGYFQGGIEDKLKHLIQQFKAHISMFPITERETDFYRANINACQLLLDWGDEMISERNSYVAGDKASADAFDLQKDAEANQSVENIKSKIKE